MAVSSLVRSNDRHVEFLARLPRLDKAGLVSKSIRKSEFSISLDSYPVLRSFAGGCEFNL